MLQRRGMIDIFSSIRWGWAFIGAVVTQAALIVVVYVIGAVASGWGWLRSDYVLTPAAHVLVPFLGGIWVAQRARAHFTANGTALGVFCALIYLPVLVVAPPPYPLMEAGNGLLKVIGAAMGGGLIGRRARRRSRMRN
jgi:hypothetical protein